MEELTTEKLLLGSGKKFLPNKCTTNHLTKIVMEEYENPHSPAFGKNANTVRQIVLTKFPEYKKVLTSSLTEKILESSSTTYSTTQKPRQNKHFRGMSFYSPHPHYKWHVDLQDMTIFRKAANLRKSDAHNFMLVCVDDFSNYIMVKLIKIKEW